MTKEEIIQRVHKRYVELGYPPKSNDPALGKGLLKESQRKIGSWRKVLWLTGSLNDERREQYKPISKKSQTHKK